MAGAALTRVTACQVRLDIDDPAATRERVLTAARGAAASADVVVLPELAGTGYVFADAAEAAARAEPVDGPFVTALREVSADAGCVLVSGFAERGPAGVHNSAVVIDRGEVVAVHRKVHLWGEEPRCFAPGDAPVPVVDTSAGRLGLLVCYDLEFFEYVASAARRGAQLLVAPVSWPAPAPPPAGERPVDVARTQAMAALFRVFVAVADRCGAERGVDWVGGSVIVGPDGYPLAGPAAAGEEARVSAEVDLALADDKRLGEHNHVFDDRRPPAYG